MKEILSLEEISEYLGMHKCTLYRLLKEGKIPGKKIGGQWRFRRSTIDKWMDGGE